MWKENTVVCYIGSVLWGNHLSFLSRNLKYRDIKKNINEIKKNIFYILV